MPAHTHPHIGLRIRIRMNEPNESVSEPNERVNRANWMNLTNRVIGWTESLYESSYLKRIKQSNTNHTEPNKPLHQICTEHKRYYEQPITHEPTASDERTNKYGLVKQHQVNFFRIRWTTMCAWTTTDRIGWNKQITLSERWQILWLTNESRNNKQKHPIYKPKSNLQTWIERLCKLKSAMRKPKANNIRLRRRTSEFSPTASDLLKANQERKKIGKSDENWTKYLR